MTRVCLIGNDDCNLQYELLSRETSREALATYDLTRPFENSLSVRTVSVGAAVSLLNDLQWYLTRFVDEALVLEPSVSDDEWLSRALARELRNGDVDPDETGEFCKIYGLERVDAATETGESDVDREADDEGDARDANDSDAGTTASFASQRLVEPLYVRRAGGELPAYDLCDVEETLVVRVTEAEYT
ncbi:DUF5804 family protein [Natrarchaeobaculum sulfurireducens]|uniref:Uncharacterized protein n=1 Tax=Natrarchaeobaculum sulfurireducens TaxID=2044521 RepID=A0A346PQA6_9EURY|nr:DUF5804 family protein [Natrarchaeobaculum sulfurireducens]AXR78267.1 hypothetical protein AArc1_1947 [Natrarchaeobaculum sulfurireducens]AXR81701.1 hypothetical protein AArcMg_1691 [Natrarchaeobaculum sulfurireducens]